MPRSKQKAKRKKRAEAAAQMAAAEAQIAAQTDWLQEWFDLLAKDDATAWEDNEILLGKANHVLKSNRPWASAEDFFLAWKDFPITHVLIVYRLNTSTTNDHLEAIFSSFDSDVIAQVIRHPSSGFSLRYGFLIFTSALQCFNAFLAYNNFITVQLAVNRVAEWQRFCKAEPCVRVVTVDLPILDPLCVRRNIRHFIHHHCDRWMPDYPVAGEFEEAETNFFDVLEFDPPDDYDWLDPNLNNDEFRNMTSV